MNLCREAVKMGVPPGNRPAVPRDWSEAYLTVRRRSLHPRTPGRTVISTVIAADS
jgi:hypothetical protein